MLIIFDLDDTLIDTSGCITYHKLEKALRRMVREGLLVPHFSEALDLLRRLNTFAESAREALAEFIEILGADVRFFHSGVEEVYENFSDDLSVVSLEGVLETLSELAQEHQLALVTMGFPVWQMEKLKKAGIDFHLFSKIVIVDQGSKGSAYQTVVNELGYAPEEVLVCGDRILVDLLPARDLGFKTVQMQWGRALNPSLRDGENVDYRILEMRLLKEVVNRLMTGYL